MSHDDLLTKIAFDSAHHLREALRAVVELHKPYLEHYCSGCTSKVNIPGAIFYPCPTIRAIEKELK